MNQWRVMITSCDASWHVWCSRAGCWPTMAHSIMRRSQRNWITWTRLLVRYSRTWPHCANIRTATTCAKWPIHYTNAGKWAIEQWEWNFLVYTCIYYEQYFSFSLALFLGLNGWIWMKYFIALSSYNDVNVLSIMTISEVTQPQQNATWFMIIISIISTFFQSWKQ